MRHRRPHHQQRAAQIHIDNLVEDLGIGVLQVASGRHCGIVDQAIQPAKAGHRRLNQTGTCLGVGQVGNHIGGVFTQIVTDFAGELLFKTMHHDLSAFSHTKPRRCFTNPGR
jgi:hypothetical protein